MPKNIYVLSDIHGHYNVFIKMLEKIKFSDDDVLYILGDCCDRGPDSLKIYLYIQKFKNIHLIRGNHEIMMRDALLLMIQLHHKDECGLKMVEIKQPIVIMNIYKRKPLMNLIIK
ncbi:metallophosphoesterase [Coprobacillaceae bacterium CR2/5/TPMF4]|nr:metallophosphoesterase [Coprobacillaceae bacterium CR2/5/TPMF4]